MTSMHCSTCKVKVPKHRPILTCTICKQLRHHKCSFLTKTEAQQIITGVNGYYRYWSCHECISSVQVVTVNQESFYCCECGGLFIETVDDNDAEQRRMFKSIEENEARRRRNQG